MRRTVAKKATATIYPLAALRALALHTQRLSTHNDVPSPPTPDAIVELVRALGYVQIDALHVVNRAHYLTLWSRLGSYDPDALDLLIYTDGHRQLYEGWGHAASIIPLEHYRYHRWRSDPTCSFNPTFRNWLKKDGNRELVEQVLARLRDEGALRVRDLGHDGPPSGVWYDWKPPKTALEVLFARGDLMVADRVHFQRVYEVTERVLPTWVDTGPVPPEEARRFCFEKAARALGVFERRHLTFYAYLRATPVRDELKGLIEDGTLVEIRGQTTEGVRNWLVHRDNLPLLERAAGGEIRAERTTFLSPFDSLFWAQKRDRRLWGFEQVLECYKPADQRIYGYFCLPILHRDRLVGRLDPKLDRKRGVLHIKALHLEPGVEPDEELVADVAGTLREFVAWHGATDVVFEKCDPRAFGDRVERAL